MQFETAGIRVTQLERSVRFYTKALGFKVERRGDTRSWGGGKWVLLIDPRSRRRVELNWYPKGSLFYRRYMTGEALDHLDFSAGVMSRRRFETLYRTMLNDGGRPSGYAPSDTAGWMFSVLDPDGVWITVGRRPTAAERRATK